MTPRDQFLIKTNDVRGALKRGAFPTRGTRRQCTRGTPRKQRCDRKSKKRTPKKRSGRESGVSRDLAIPARNFGDAAVPHCAELCARACARRYARARMIPNRAFGFRAKMENPKSLSLAKGLELFPRFCAPFLRHEYSDNREDRKESPVGQMDWYFRFGALKTGGARTREAKENRATTFSSRCRTNCICREAKGLRSSNAAFAGRRNGENRRSDDFPTNERNELTNA